MYVHNNGTAVKYHDERFRPHPGKITAIAIIVVFLVSAIAYVFFWKDRK